MKIRTSLALLALPVIGLAAFALSSFPARQDDARQDDTNGLYNSTKIIGDYPTWVSGKYNETYLSTIQSGLAAVGLPGYESYGPISFINGSPGYETHGRAYNLLGLPASVAVVQRDVAQRINGKPIPGDRQGRSYYFTVLQENLGPRCAFMVAHRDNPTLVDVLRNSSKLTVFTGIKYSDDFNTYNVLTETYPELASVHSVIHAGVHDYQLVELVRANPQSIGFFTALPDSRNFAFISLFGSVHRDDLVLVPLNEERFLAKGYEPLDVKVVAWRGTHDDDKDKYYQTACTSVVLITGQADSADTLEEKTRVEQLVALTSGADKTQLFVPQTPEWRAMMSNIKQAPIQTLDQMH